MRKVADFLAFQACWWACVAGAAHGLTWLGPLAVALFLAARLAVARRRLPLAALAIAAAALGLGFDGALTAAGVLRFPAGIAGPWPPAPPAWMLALWVAFALTLRCSLAWLSGRFALAAALGAVAGPLAYVAGERLAAVTLLRPLPLALLALAGAWALATPLLVGLSDALARRPAAGAQGA